MIVSLQMYFQSCLSGCRKLCTLALMSCHICLAMVNATILWFGVSTYTVSCMHGSFDKDTTSEGVIKPCAVLQLRCILIARTVYLRDPTGTLGPKTCSLPVQEVYQWTKGTHLWINRREDRSPSHIHSVTFSVLFLWTTASDSFNKIHVAVAVCVHLSPLTRATVLEIFVTIAAPTCTFPSVMSV